MSIRSFLGNWIARHNQLLWSRSNGQRLERSQVPPSPLPRSFGIMGLGEIPARSLGLKDLRVRSSRTNNLGCQRALKMGLGQLRGPSWLTDTPRNCPNQISIVTHHGS